MWSSPRNPDLKLVQRYQTGSPELLQKLESLLLGHFSSMLHSFSNNISHFIPYSLLSQEPREHQLHL